jgi:hypothetical protein
MHAQMHVRLSIDGRWFEEGTARRLMAVNDSHHCEGDQHMKRIALVTIVALTTTLMAPAFAAAEPAPAAASSLSIPISGSGSGATFSGVFQLQKFVTQQGAVYATGVLSGTVTTAAGAVTSIVQTIALPVRVGQTTCEILHLDIGPISLDLLGLQIDLSRIVLDITAQAGSGNLLGNLLCAVAGLLDDPSGLARLLNQILALL